MIRTSRLHRTFFGAALVLMIGGLFAYYVGQTSAADFAPAKIRNFQVYPGERVASISFDVLNPPSSGRADWSISWDDGETTSGSTDTGTNGVERTHNYSNGKTYKITVCVENDAGGECKTKNATVEGPAPQCNAGSTECSDCLDNNGNGRADFNGVESKGWPKDSEHCNALEDDWEGGPSTPYFHVTITSNWDPSNFRWVVTSNSGPRYKEAFDFVRSYGQGTQTIYEWRTRQEINGQGNATLTLIDIPDTMTYTITEPWRSFTQNYSGRAADSPLNWTIEFENINDPTVDLRVNNGNYASADQALAADVGSALLFTWNSDQVSQCWTTGGQGGWARGSVPANQATPDVFTTPNLPGTLIRYDIACSSAVDGTTVSDSVYVSVQSPAGGNLSLECRPIGTTSWSTGPCSVMTNENIELRWTGVDLATCTASGGWSGGKPTSGTATEGPITDTTIYALNCTENDGGTVARTVTVTPLHLGCAGSACTVLPGGGPNACTNNVQCGGGEGEEGSCVMSANPDRIVHPGDSRLSWSCERVTNCSVNELGAVDPSGSGMVSPDMTTTYTVACTGENGGPVSANATVRVFRFEGGVLKEIIP